MKILNWHIDRDLKEEINKHYQAREAIEMRKSGPKEIIGMYTFSYGAPNLTLEKAQRFLDFTERLAGKDIQGVGVEVGAGPGTHSALLSNRGKVKKVYALEASAPIVENLSPIVIPYVAPDNHQKVISVIGEFDNIELPDSSVDFVFDFFSLHHSTNLHKTIMEIHRVLKPGGFVLCLDKARDDNLTREDLDKLLDKEYSRDFKIKMGVPVNQKHTRRMNGENEYRLKDWFDVFEKVGFSRYFHYNIARTQSSLTLVRLIKEMLSLCPHWLQCRVTRFLPIKSTNNISHNNRIYSKLINDYQKEISLLVAYK